MNVQEYDIQNLDCASCAGKIEAEINSLPEVQSANLDFVNRRLTVQYNSAIDQPLQKLNGIAATIEPGVTITLSGAEASVKRNTTLWLVLGGSLVLMTGSLLAPSVLKPWLGLAAWLLAGHRVLINAGKSLLSKQLFSEQMLMSIATIGAVILGEYVEAAAVMVLYKFGQWLESRALEHSRRSIRGMLSLKPDKAHLKTTAGVVETRLGEVPVGATIIVNPGERVPLDGVILKGESTVDTSTLTGEAEPLYVNPGAEIFAGFLNHSGRLEIKVTSSEAESTVTRILNLIENAGTRKSQQEKFITRFARIYTPVVVGIAILVFLIPTILGHPAAVWFRRSLVFLIVSCPCALVISIPLSYYIGIGVAAKKGIIFKGSEYLDVLRRVKTVVFDKTGTLTTGEMKVEKVFVREGSEPVELMHSLWLAEHSSSHPFAKAIRSAYEGDFDPALVNAYSEYPGRGVLLQYGQDRLLAGSEAFLKEYGFIDPIPAKSHSTVHAAKNDFYLGCVTFSDTLKPGIKDTLAQLKTQGVERAIMLSGDRREKAEKVSRETGLDEFHAELLPSYKLERLEEIMAREQGKTAFVGDGMNDTPALARADAGIAMGAIGNQASVETADIVLLNDKPEQLAAAFSISRRTGMLVAQNIAIALGVKALVMVLGVGGISGLWEAIIADVGVTLIVIFNSLRLLRSERRA